MIRLRLGYIPLIDAAPLIVAHELGFAAEEGLQLQLTRLGAWAHSRDMLGAGLIDAAHMLVPMPIGQALGLGPDLPDFDLVMFLSHGVNAVQGGATTLEAVRGLTKASGSCGTCTGLVEQVMRLTLGDGFAAAAPAGMCKCTDHSHEDVRRLIRSMGLRSIAAVMQDLGWKTVGGCHSCRPALNFYLLAEWPLDYQDDRQSRFVNERNHANIQKDGTYSVVPRMWGGVTTPAELRAIADAADKYGDPWAKHSTPTETPRWAPLADLTLEAAE